MGKLMNNGIAYGGASSGSSITISKKEGNEIKQESDGIYVPPADLKRVELTQAEYDALGDEKLTNGVEYFVKDGKGGEIVVDSELSTTSTNPAQNKVITNKLNELSETISDYVIFRTTNQTITSMTVGRNEITPTKPTEAGYAFTLINAMSGENKDITLKGIYNNMASFYSAQAQSCVVYFTWIGIKTN